MPAYRHKINAILLEIWQILNSTQREYFLKLLISIIH